AGITNDDSSLYVLGGPTIRRIVIATAEGTTVAGQAGWPGAEGGNGPRPRFWGPLGIASEVLEGGGALLFRTLFITDTDKNSIPQADCGGDLPKDLAVTPIGNPTGPVTGVDYLQLSWAPQFAGLNPNSFEWAINGDAFTSAALSTSAVAPPRN